MSERNPKRFENGSNAQQRSAEEQRRLMEEYDQARYEEAFPAGEDAEKAYDEAMAARDAEGAAREYDENVLTEGRILERPEANFMYMMAQQIAELRANGGEPMIIEGKENRLQELLEKYTEKAHAERDLALKNAEINERSTVKGRQLRLEQEIEAEEELEKRLQEADFIINSTDEAWVNEKLKPAGKEEKTTEAESVDVDKDRVKDEDEARMLADAERVVRAVRSNPEAAEKAGVYDKIEELIAEIDAALAAAEAKPEEALDGPKSADDLDDGKEKLRAPKDSSDLDDGDEALEEPKDELSDDEELHEPKSADDLDDGKAVPPKSADDLEGEAEPGDEEEEPRRRRNIFGRAWDRLNLAYAERGGTPAGVVAHGLERLRSSDKGKVAATIGLLAVVGTLIAGRHYGWFDGGSGGSGTDQAANGGHHGGGHPVDTGDHTPPAPTGPEIPSGENYAHPWNWMEAAIDNGSITPPKGMGAEQALHYYGEKAAAAGHKVEWYNLPNGLEAIRVDGSDDTKVVGDVLTQFAK